MSETGPQLPAAISVPSRLMTALGRIWLGLAALGLGVIGVTVGDFALQWQPVPQEIPGRTGLAYAAALVLAALGAGLLIRRRDPHVPAMLAAFFLLWTLVLHGPAVAAKPLSVLAWLPFCEILAIAAGTAALAAMLGGDTALAQRGGRVAGIVFAVCLPVFGLSHFAYPAFTASMIPDFIPFPLFWAWFTGAGHAAAGLAMLSGILARTAAVLFAVMVSGFVLLLHVPRVIGAPDSRHEWTMLAVSSLIAGAAWLMAGSVAARAEAGARAD